MKIPSDVLAEQQLLGSFLQDASILDELIAKIDPDIFYNQKYREIYISITNVFRHEGVVDNILINTDLAKRKCLDVANLIDLMNVISETFTTINWKKHYKMLNKLYKRRLLINAGRQLMITASEEENFDEVLKNNNKLIDNLEDDHTSSIHKIGNLTADSYERACQLKANPESSNRVKTGFYDLDTQLGGGLVRGELITIAARPAMGKSAFIKDIQMNVAKLGYNVHSFNLEMSNEQTSDRMLSAESSVSSTKIQMGNFDDAEQNKMLYSANELKDLPIYMIDDFDLSLQKISNICRKQAKRLGGLDLITIDYLQLLESSNSKFMNRAQEIAVITRGLKKLAKELNCVIIELSQLNRECEKRPVPRPIMADLKESGSIEENSAVVIFLFRYDYYFKEKTKPILRNITEVIVGKSRFGPVGTIELYFDAAITKFRSYKRSY
jgi:replicative DNA helicase